MSIKIARDYLDKNPTAKPKVVAANYLHTGYSKECIEIVKFLNWAKHKVRNALIAIEDFEQKNVKRIDRKFMIYHNEHNKS